MLNQMLIEKGLARVAIFQPDVKYVEQFRAAQQKVQKQAIGIWSIENYAQEDGYQTKQNKSKTCGSQTNRNRKQRLLQAAVI